MGDERSEVIAVHSYRMDALEKQMAELCTKIGVLIETLPERYQTKEMCINMSNHCRSRNDERYDALKVEVEMVSGKYDRLLWTTISCAGVVIWDLAKAVVPLILNK